MSKTPPSPEKPSPQPVSIKIRERISRAKQHFHANDNIAAFLEPGDLEALISLGVIPRRLRREIASENILIPRSLLRDRSLDEVEGKMKDVLNSLVIDTDSDHNTQNTARRVAKMYLTEVFDYCVNFYPEVHYQS